MYLFASRCGSWIFLSVFLVPKEFFFSVNLRSCGLIFHWCLKFFFRCWLTTVQIFPSNNQSLLFSHNTIYQVAQFNEIIQFSVFFCFFAVGKSSSSWKSSSWFILIFTSFTLLLYWTVTSGTLLPSYRTFFTVLSFKTNLPLSLAEIPVGHLVSLGFFKRSRWSVQRHLRVFRALNLYSFFSAFVEIFRPYF